MSRCALYTSNTSNQDVEVNGIISPGTIVRRYGPNLNLSGNAIQLSGPGYYKIDTSITLAPVVEGEVTVSIYKDGVLLQGATATATAAAAGDTVNLALSAIIREFCSCCEGLSNLTFVLTEGAATVTNIAITVEKL